MCVCVCVRECAVAALVCVTCLFISARQLVGCSVRKLFRAGGCGQYFRGKVLRFDDASGRCVVVYEDKEQEMMTLAQMAVMVVYEWFL